MVSSLSSGSRGPRPKTSSRTSWATRSRSDGAERNALLGDDLLNDGEELVLAGAGFLRLAQLLEVEAVDQLVVDSGLEFLLFLLAQGTGIGRAGAQSGTVGAQVVAVGTCLREVEREIAHRYSVLFWPNKEKPLRAGWALTAASSTGQHGGPAGELAEIFRSFCRDRSARRR